MPNIKRDGSTLRVLNQTSSQSSDKDLAMRRLDKARPPDDAQKLAGQSRRRVVENRFDTGFKSADRDPRGAVNPREVHACPADEARLLAMETAYNREVARGMKAAANASPAERKQWSEVLTAVKTTIAGADQLEVPNARAPFRADDLPGATSMTAKFATLEPNREGTRTLKAAFALEVARVNQAVAKGTMSAADVEQWSSRMTEVAAAIIPGRDPLEVVGRTSGAVLTQPKRVNLEASNDWSLTTRTEAQDAQCHMIAGLLAGKVPWDAGLAQINAVATASPPEGQPQSLEERGAMLHTVREPQKAFWAAAQGAETAKDASQVAQPGMNTTAREDMNAKGKTGTAVIVNNPATGSASAAATGTSNAGGISNPSGPSGSSGAPDTMPEFTGNPESYKDQQAHNKKMFAYQQAMSIMQQFWTQLSNVQKSNDDTKKGIIGNMR